MDILKKKIRRAKIISWVLIAVIGISIFSIPKAEATPLGFLGGLVGGPGVGALLGAIDGILAEKNNEMAYAMVFQIQCGSYSTIGEIIGGSANGTGSAFHSLYEFMVNGSSLAGATLENALANFINLMKFMGLMWAFAIAMSHIFTRLEQGQDPMDTIFRFFLELCIVGVFIIRSDDIMSAIPKAGEAIMATIPGINEAGSSDVEQAKAVVCALGGGVDHGDVLWGLGVMMKLVFPWIMSYIAKGATIFVVLQVVIEIGVRKAFAPLAIADVYQEGLRSPGVRYIKKYLGAYLKLVVCVIIGYITAQFIATSAMKLPTEGINLGSTFDWMLSVIVLQFVAVGAMVKGGEITNEVVGA